MAASIIQIEDLPAERKLATIALILNLSPIEGADRIVLARVRGWQCIVKIGEFQVGDLCVYFEIDSLLPKDNPTFADMKRCRWRVKTMRMRGKLSQGRALPLSLFPEIDNPKEDDDVTQLLKVIKYEPLSPFARMARGRNRVKIRTFPTFLVKTGCDRIQNLRKSINKGRFRTDTFYVTEKIDGASGTFGYLANDDGSPGEFLVCSRNHKVSDSEDSHNFWWRVVRKFHLSEIMKSFPGFIIQGEIVAPKLQKNRYGVSEGDIDFFVFRCNDTINQRFVGWKELVTICSKMGLHMVPILKVEVGIEPDSIDEWLAYAESEESQVYPELEGVIREGVVLSPMSETPFDEYQTIKVISNKYLLN